MMLIDLRSRRLASFDAEHDLTDEQRQAVQALDLSRNFMRALPLHAFTGLATWATLTHLYLGANELTELPNVAALVSLHELHLNNNKIATILPQALVTLTQLRVLNLRSNHLHVLPSNSFDGLAQLTWLSVSTNLLDDTTLASQPFRPLKCLRFLGLYGNNLSCVDLLTDALVGLDELESVMIGANPVAPAAVSAIRARLPSIQWLDWAHV